MSEIANTLELSEPEVTAVEGIRLSFESALSGKTESIDIDELFLRLKELECEISALNLASHEAATLREDLIDRTESMLKAVAVVSPESEERFDVFSESQLEALDAKGLLMRYRKTCALYRDCFGGSLRYLPASATKGKEADWSDYRS